jgi:hypothetical protein
MYRAAYDRQMLRRLRYVSAGTEHIVWDGGIVLLSVLMRSNYPPVEHTEERFRSFDPRLEIHPSGCEDIEVAIIRNPMKKDWGPWSDYPKAEKNRLLHLAEANRMSKFKKGFGNPEPMQAKSYVQPDVWLQPVFAHNGVISSEGTSGYQCTLCGVYAEKDGMLEHIRSNEHLQKASTSPFGVWANPSPGPVAALSSAASGSGSDSCQPGRSFEEIKAAGLNVTQGPSWEPMEEYDRSKIVDAASHDADEATRCSLGARYSGVRTGTEADEYARRYGAAGPR